MQINVALEQGTLNLTIESGTHSPDELFGFAQRRNPKRAFLFVSKVLGRHIPVSPAVMRNATDTLAAQIPPTYRAGRGHRHGRNRDCIGGRGATSSQPQP
ncbi:phosphoribosyltransferase domain-containing protein [Candidatus Thiothrix anitrata]|uniref:Phosphoribosyltransferase domain-containing protein n=1 Tax=Candidatus Thiothrix anitrata TaxID=2823902 RepID=A0ABX7X0D2_9GAMM|nr:phosphoribosyltransferase domain-containing protein [Candidatus Thiothrix anitrata]